MSKTKDDGGAAFPLPDVFAPDEHGCVHVPGQSGMSLRDYFAAQALNGLLAADVGDDKWQTYEAIIKQAWSLADAMLAARKPKL